MNPNKSMSEINTKTRAKTMNMKLRGIFMEEHILLTFLLKTRMRSQLQSTFQCTKCLTIMNFHNLKVILSPINFKKCGNGIQIGSSPNKLCSQSLFVLNFKKMSKNLNIICCNFQHFYTFKHF